MKDLNQVEIIATVDPAKLELFINDLNFKLPNDYILFLYKYNGGGFQEDAYPIAERVSKVQNRGLISWFYAIAENSDYNLEKITTYLKGKRIPDDLIPIGCDPGGNQVCLGIKGGNYGKVYFWDHEEEVEDGEVPDYRNVYLIANSFTDFINSLYVYDE